ncbi:CopG family transcriptional regulator, partial [Dysosmobacter welbionis]
AVGDASDLITVVDGIAVIGQGVLAVFLHVGRAVLVGVIAPDGINFIVGSQGELVNGIRAV